jgi:outer membrane protein assembly factor BamB
MMPRTWTTVFLLLSSVLTAPSLVRAQLKAEPGDWPQWRGPDRTGVSAETGLLKEWPKEGPKLLWKATDLGGGYSTPSVSNGRIYLMGNRSNEEYLLALDARDGKQVWSIKVGAVGPNRISPWPGTRSTPTVDGELVYALGSDGDLVCAETADGKVRWRKHLKKDFNGVTGAWAYAESPLLDGDALICTPGGARAALVALNKKSGDVLWKAEVPGGGEAGYASAVVAEVGGVKQYLQFLGGGVVGVDAKTGKSLWFHKLVGNMNIMTPVFHDSCVFVASGGNGPQRDALLQLSADGPNVTATPVYVGKELSNHHGGVVQIGDYLYGTNSAGQLVCLEFKTGKVKWQNRSVGKGSVTAADGHLYVRSESGPIALVEATPEGYREKGRFTPPDRQQSREQRYAWPHPVLAGGRLYLRDGNILLCYDVKAQ